MYDYMKALQKRFDRQEHSELDKQVEYAQEELRRGMDAAGRKKLLLHGGLQTGVGYGERAGGRWALFLRTGGRRTHLPSGGTGGLNGKTKTCR